MDILKIKIVVLFFAVFVILINQILSQNSVYTEQVKNNCEITHLSISDNVNYHYECKDGKTFVLDHDIFKTGFMS